MKKLYVFILIAIFTGCIKTAQQVQENIVIQAITTGQWKVTTFINDGTDVSSSFSAYTFHFKTDLKVDAINNGSVENTGSWNADANSKTITSNFSNPSATLLLLNGTWTITNSSLTSVDAILTLNGKTRTLRLDKI